MRDIAIRTKVMLALLWVFASPALGNEKGVRMSEPFLHISYDTKTVRYDYAPRESVTQNWRLECQPCWLYASYDETKSPLRRYVIVSGLEHQLLDTSPPKRDTFPVPGHGHIYVFDGANYEVADFSIEDLHDHANQIPKGVYSGLVKDAIERMTRAFGGHDAVQKAIHDQISEKATYYGPLSDAFREAGFDLPCNSKYAKECMNVKKKGDTH